MKKALSSNFSKSWACFQDVGLWLEEINLGSYRQVFKENGVNGEYLESLSMFTTEQILRFIRRCHMKWGDFITLCKELRRIKGSTFLFLIFSFSKIMFVAGPPIYVRPHMSAGYVCQVQAAFQVYALAQE